MTPHVTWVTRVSGLVTNMRRWSQNENRCKHDAESHAHFFNSLSEFDQLFENEESRMISEKVKNEISDGIKGLTDSYKNISSDIESRLNLLNTVSEDLKTFNQGPFSK